MGLVIFGGDKLSWVFLLLRFLHWVQLFALGFISLDKVCCLSFGFYFWLPLSDCVCKAQVRLACNGVVMFSFVRGVFQAPGSISILRVTYSLRHQSLACSLTILII